MKTWNGETHPYKKRLMYKIRVIHLQCTKLLEVEIWIHQLNYLQQKKKYHRSHLKVWQCFGENPIFVTQCEAAFTQNLAPHQNLAGLCCGRVAEGVLPNSHNRTHRVASSCVVRCVRVYVRSQKDVTGRRSVTQPVVAKKSNLMQLLLPQKSVFF